MTPDDLLYSPLTDESNPTIVLNGLPCTDRQIVEYLLYLYRTNAPACRLFPVLENLSEVWDRAGNSCVWGNKTWPHVTMEQRAEATRKENRKAYQRWLLDDAVLIHKASDCGKTEIKTSYVLPPPVIPVDDDKLDYGFSE